jgi:diguanylate cyclase (GGDEF)-like protein
MIDVDRFKTYNDSFGHPAGDAVLKQLAQIIRDTYRPTDVYARYGGEEFVVLLPRTDQHGAITAAERCRAAIACSEWPFRPITASMGVATLRPGMKAPELTECADRALYHCKHSGRNCVSHVEHIKLAQTAPPDN